MKKILNSKIFFFIIVLIMASGISVYGIIKMQADEVGYGKDNKTVKDALDELYSKAQNKNVNTMTQEQWNNLTLEQKISSGLTLIESDQVLGKYYDYSNYSDKVVPIGGSFTSASGSRTINFDSIDERRSTLFISSVNDNSNNSNITIGNQTVSKIANNPPGEIYSNSIIYSHALIIPNYTSNSLPVTYQTGDGGTYWSGGYAFDVADEAIIATSKASFTTTNTITMSVEKCKYVIFMINSGFSSGLANLNYTINNDTYTLKSVGNHFGCNTYTGFAIYANDKQTDSYTITIPSNANYGFSVTAIGIN